MTNETQNPQSQRTTAGPGSATGPARRLALRRRRDLICVPQTFSGRTVWAIKDPVALRYYHLTQEEYWVFEALDGSSSLAEIQNRFERRFAPRRLTLAQVQSFLGLLHQEGLIIPDAPGQAAFLLERARTRRLQRLVETLANILAVRFRGIDPQAFLDWLLSRCPRLVSGWSLAIGAAVVMAAAALVVTRIDAVQSRLPEFQSFLTPRAVAWLGAALALTKVLHELGHALTCRYFGAECHELGLMFLVFTPCLYCNVSDAWMIANKWRRAAIGAAGVGVELFLAGLCTILWWFSEPGMLNTLCFNVMLICSASTLLFNGNPLMRYDGYYILSDLVEIPNLAQVAARAWHERIAAWLLGIPAPFDDEFSPGQRAFLVGYATLSTLYRTAVVAGIFWFLHRVAKPYHLEALSDLLALLVAGGLVAGPCWRTLQSIQNAWWSRQMNPRRALVRVSAVALCLVAACFIPFPHRVTAPAVLEAEAARRVYVPVAGTLAGGAEIGSTIRAGDPVARLTNLELQLEIARLRGRRDQQKLHLENLKRRQAREPEAAAQIPTAAEALADLEDQLQKRLDDESRLVVAAPVSGTVLPGRRRIPSHSPGELESWSGLPLEPANRGCYLETGTLLCQIGDPARLEAALVLEQADVELVRAGQRVSIQLEQNPGRVLSGTIQEIAEIDLAVTPAELLPAGTIPTRADETGVPRPVETVYQARVSLPAADAPLVIGQAGRARVHAGSMSLARRLARFLNRTFRFEL